MGAKPPPLPRRVFDYAPRPSAYSATEALLLCAPGVLCWLLYVVQKLVGNDTVPNRNLPRGMMLALLPAALATAVISVWIFCRKPTERKRWFIYLNLAVNISGLYFAATQIAGYTLH